VELKVKEAVCIRTKAKVCFPKVDGRLLSTSQGFKKVGGVECPFLFYSTALVVDDSHGFGYEEIPYQQLLGPSLNMAMCQAPSDCPILDCRGGAQGSVAGARDLHPFLRKSAL